MRRTVCYAFAVGGGAQASVKLFPASTELAETKVEVRRVSMTKAIGIAGGLDSLQRGVE